MINLKYNNIWGDWQKQGRKQAHKDTRKSTCLSQPAVFVRVKEGFIKGNASEVHAHERIISPISPGLWYMEQ